MNYLPISGLPMVEEDEATDEVAQIYAEAKREMQVPFVPNFVKAVAISPAALAILWNAYRAFLQHSTLPQSLTAMIHFMKQAWNWSGSNRPKTRPNVSCDGMPLGNSRKPSNHSCLASPNS